MWLGAPNIESIKLLLVLVVGFFFKAIVVFERTICEPGFANIAYIIHIKAFVFVYDRNMMEHTHGDILTLTYARVADGLFCGIGTPPTR